jgi:DNA-binding transcriptional MerR regulator
MEDPDSSPETPDSTPKASPRSGKSEAAFRTISEVSGDLAVPQHVLRFWESKFSQIKPLKRGGGRRYYRPEDVRLLGQIRDLLYKDGYTIRGVQKLLREPPAAKAKAPPATPPAAEPPPPAAPADRRQALTGMIAELRELRQILAQARRK